MTISQALAAVKDERDEHRGTADVLRRQAEELGRSARETSDHDLQRHYLEESGRAAGQARYHDRLAEAFDIVLKAAKSK